MTSSGTCNRRIIAALLASEVRYMSDPACEVGYLVHPGLEVQYVIHPASEVEYMVPLWLRDRT
jgi:hypothetical protein